MELYSSYRYTLFIIVSMMMIFVSFANPFCPPGLPEHAVAIYKEDMDQMQFAENLEHLECDFFLWSALGYGLDEIAPELTMGGPPPIGAQRANLDSVTRNIIQEFGYQEVGHLRALKTMVGGLPRPQLDLRAENFAKLFNKAFGYQLLPPFNPYRDSISYMLACYVVPYMGVQGYSGTILNINGYETKKLLAGLLAVEAGQDAIIRHYLYERSEEIVQPYNHTIREFTNRISTLRNEMALCGMKDEGIFVTVELGAENRTTSNVISGDYNSLAYGRTPQEILRVLYNSRNESMPGGFFPQGANGRIAREFLNNP